MTIYALAVHGSIKQLGNGNLTDTDVVTALTAKEWEATEEAARQRVREDKT